MRLLLGDSKVHLVPKCHQGVSDDVAWSVGWEMNHVPWPHLVGGAVGTHLMNSNLASHTADYVLYASLIQHLNVARGDNVTNPEIIDYFIHGRSSDQVG